MKLGLWQRVGLVLTVVWIAGSAVLSYRDTAEKADDFSNWGYKVCLTTKAIEHNSDATSCETERQKNLATWREHITTNAALTAVLPIPFLWLGAAILLYGFRIVVAGFRVVVPWGALNKFNRAFVCVCAVGTVAATGMASVIVMNLYVDTKVPVAIGNTASVISTGEDMVTVEGTWITSSQHMADYQMLFPLQTSTIQCVRVEPAPRCTEARASTHERTMSVELVEYDVKSWTRSAIVMTRSLPCGEETYTVDLQTKAVTGAGHRTPQDSQTCDVMGSRPDEWSYRLADGFTVYWKLRQAARPLPLRVLQTIFGN